MNDSFLLALFQPLLYNQIIRHAHIEKKQFLEHFTAIFLLRNFRYYHRFDAFYQGAASVKNLIKR